MAEDPDGSVEKLVNKPKNTRFHQQRLKSWRPVLTAKGAYPMFLAIGLVFIPIGIALLVTSNKVFERVFEYTHCERSPAAAVPSRCSEEVRSPAFYQNYQSCPCTVSFTLDEAVDGQVYFFYGLSNFFQNHRRYIMSKDDAQLLGGTGPLSDACEPYRTNPKGVPYAPCGAIAMSLFNDTFSLKYHGSTGSPLAQPVNVPMSNKNIAWRSDVEKKFGQPPASYWAQTVKPDSWPVSAVNRSPEAFRGDEELIVWMRAAALPTFRKLHRLIEHTGQFQSGLPAGSYSVDIGYSYPVTQFGGTKRFILSTESWLGGRNPTLGIAYIVVGSICLALGILFLVLHYRLPRRYDFSQTLFVRAALEFVTQNLCLLLLEWATSMIILYSVGGFYVFHTRNPQFSKAAVTKFYMFILVNVYGVAARFIFFSLKFLLREDASANAINQCMLPFCIFLCAAIESYCFSTNLWGIAYAILFCRKFSEFDRKRVLLANDCGFCERGEYPTELPQHHSA